MPHKPRNPKKKKNKTAAQKQSASHGWVGETSLQFGSQALEQAPPVEGDVMRELTAQEVCEISDMIEVQVVSARILEKLQAADSRRSDGPLPERLQPVLSSIREKAGAYLSQILHLLEDDDSESSESSEKLAPEPNQQRDQTTPKEEDPPHPGQVPLHFHIYASALLPEPYVAQGWHYVPVLQHGAPPPAGGNQFVPVLQHGAPPPAGGNQFVPVLQHGAPPPAGGNQFVPVLQHGAPPPAGGNQFVPVLQHGAPPPAGGNQFVPVQEHVVPTPAGGYKPVLVHHGKPMHHMPMPLVLSTYRPGYPQHNRRAETSAPLHGNEERQQDSQANNPSQNNSLQGGVPESNLGAHQCTLGAQTGEIQAEESAAH